MTNIKVKQMDKQEDKENIFEQRMSDYLSETITEEEKTELFSLIRESEEYRIQYAKMAKLHALLNVPSLEAEKEASYRRFSQRMQYTPGTKGGRGWAFWARSVAAAIVLVVLASVLSVQTYKHQTSLDNNQLCEAIVPLGSQTKIVLPDGSTVVLRSGSILKYPSVFGTEKRNVYLVGEGYFEVAKDAEKVFQVQVGDACIQVTGTAFNARSYPEDKKTEIDLIEGGVTFSVGGRYVSLKSDERVTYDWQTKDLKHLACDAHKSALWTTGKLSFVNESFREILKDIERKYNVKIQVMSQRVESEYFSGTINADMSLQEVFNFIDVDKKYIFEKSNGVVILRDRE